jgi:hypothetical protein
LLAIVGVVFRNDRVGAWNKLTEQMSYFVDKSAIQVVQDIAQKRPCCVSRSALTIGIHGFFSWQSF